MIDSDNIDVGKHLYHTTSVDKGLLKTLRKTDEDGIEWLRYVKNDDPIDFLIREYVVSTIVKSIVVGAALDDDESEPDKFYLHQIGYDPETGHNHDYPHIYYKSDFNPWDGRSEWYETLEEANNHVKNRKFK